MPVFAVVEYCNAVLAIVNIDPFMRRNFKLCIVDFVIGFCAAFNVSELNIAQNLVAEVSDKRQYEAFCVFRAS